MSQTNPEGGDTGVFDGATGEYLGPVKRELDRDQRGKLEEAVDETLAALGAALAKRFPECQSGDESPDMVVRVRAALREYAEMWLHYNIAAGP